MTDTPEYQPTPGTRDEPSQESAVGSSTALIRALTTALDSATTGSLANARELLSQGTPDADRSALRMIAVWLVSHPEAAATLRTRLQAR